MDEDKGEGDKKEKEEEGVGEGERGESALPLYLPLPDDVDAKDPPTNLCVSLYLPFSQALSQTCSIYLTTPQGSAALKAKSLFEG